MSWIIRSTTSSFGGGSDGGDVSSREPAYQPRAGELSRCFREHVAASGSVGEDTRSERLSLGDGVDVLRDVGDGLLETEQTILNVGDFCAPRLSREAQL